MKKVLLYIMLMALAIPLQAVAESFAITIQCAPQEGGHIIVEGGVTDNGGTITAEEGTTVSFRVETNNGWQIHEVSSEDAAIRLIEEESGGNRYDFVMPGSEVQIQVAFNQRGNLYLLGTANGLTEWVPTGPQFNYDPTTGEYYLDVYFKGIRQNYAWPKNGDDEYGHFSLTTMIADPDSDDPWGDISSCRLVAQSNDYSVQGGSTASLVKTTDGYSSDNAFLIPAGAYRITVNGSLTSMSIQEIPITISFNPPSGSRVEKGAVVAVSNTILDVVNGINQQSGLDEVPESDVQTRSRTNDSWYAGPNGGSNVPLYQIGEIILASECRYGQIVILDSAVYTVDPHINIVCNPSDKGSVELLETPGPGQTVTFTVHTVEGYGIESVKVVNDDTHEITTLTPDDNGIYSFVMPAADVTIRATFTIQSFNIYTECQPNYGKIYVRVNGQYIEVPDGVAMTYGSIVSFRYTTNAPDHCVVKAVTLTNLTTGEVTTFSSSSPYFFTMPASDVRITVRFAQEYRLQCIAIPFNEQVWNDVSPLDKWCAAGDSVTIHVYPETGYQLKEILAPDDVLETMVDNGDDTFTFIMPAHDVVINAIFEMIGQYRVNTVVNPEGLVDVRLYGHIKYVEGDGYFSDAFRKVKIYAQNIKDNWRRTRVSIVDADGNAIAYTNETVNEIAFWMPSSDVTVTIDYEQCRYITTSVSPSKIGRIKVEGPDVYTHSTRGTYSLEGRVVTFKVYPKLGWEIDGLLVTGANGDTLQCTDNGDGSYNLIMPGMDVKATATFRRTIGDIFERVTSLDQIQEGETYILVYNFPTNNVSGSTMAQNSENDLWVRYSVLTEYVKRNVRTRVRAGDNVLFFRLDNVQDTTCEGNLPGKAAYMNTLIDYLGANEAKTRIQVSTSTIPATRATMYYDGSPNNSSFFVRFADPNASEDEDYIYHNVEYRLSTKSDAASLELYLYKLANSHYVTTQCTPSQCGDIIITAGLNEDGMTQTGETVTFTVDTHQGRLYRVTRIANGQLKVLTPNADGVYSFEMPDADVQLLAEFVEAPHNIVVECTPADGGSVNVIDGAYAGDQVTFTVTPGEHYAFNEEELEVVDENNNPVQFTYNNVTHVYSFVMPDANVIIRAGFDATYSVNILSDPSMGCKFVALIHAQSTVYLAPEESQDYLPGEHLNVIVQNNSGYRYLGTTVVNNETGATTEYPHVEGGVPGFEMTLPAANVTLITHFEKQTDLYLLGTVNGNSAWHTTGPLFEKYGRNYRLVVYFKGYSDRDDEPDGKGYFVLSTAIDDNDDWTAIQDQLLVASHDMYDLPNNGSAMLDPSEGNQYPNPFGYRFMLEPGIYEIQVSENMAMMTIKRYNTDILIEPAQTAQNLGTKVTMEAYMDYSVIYFENDFCTDWRDVIYHINPDETDAVIHITATDANGTREGNSFDDVMELNALGETVVAATASIGYISAAATKTYRVYDPEDATIGDPLNYIESSSSPYLDGDHVVVSDELVGVWGAENILWAKDQGQLSLNYTTPYPGTIDYVRDIANLQHREWDQSNWVMLDFGPLYPNWRTDLNEYKAMHEKIKSFVDHKITPGTIHGTFHAHHAGVGYWYYEKMLCTIELDGEPTVVAQPSGTSLGYPGFMFDPTEKAGKVYEDPTRYMYNHYVPGNFVLDNLKPWGISAGEEYAEQDPLGEIPTLFFLAPMDQEVAHVWSVYMGKQEVVGDDGETVLKDVFEMLPTDYDNTPYNALGYNLESRFVVEDWKYNRLPSNITDPEGPKYGRPDNLNEDLIGKVFLFHIAIQCYYDGYMPQKNANSKVLTVDSKYLVYPLDLEKPNDSMTLVDEKMFDNVQVELEVDSIRYYNVMGQESKTPFDGINIEVIRYKDGSMTSRKIYR